mmetsp:Transcript_82474/g.128759  ORF Transcript_82474/g.128759 Transcript_82474/m.128759 type:complete len:105 (+) Transcript_82474:1099-1413(+)
MPIASPLHRRFAGSPPTRILLWHSFPQCCITLDVLNKVVRYSRPARAKASRQGNKHIQRPNTDRSQQSRRASRKKRNGNGNDALQWLDWLRACVLETHRDVIRG